MYDGEQQKQQWQQQQLQQPFSSVVLSRRLWIDPEFPLQHLPVFLHVLQILRQKAYLSLGTFFIDHIIIP